MSPPVFREGPFRFFFLPREEERMHKAPVGAIRKLERPNPVHLYWLDLDVDLSVDSIEHSERYPLKARADGPARAAGYSPSDVAGEPGSIPPAR